MFKESLHPRKCRIGWTSCWAAVMTLIGELLLGCGTGRGGPTSQLPVPPTTSHGGEMPPARPRIQLWHAATAAPKLGYLSPLFTPSSGNAAIFRPRRTTQGDRRVATEDEPQREVGITKHHQSTSATRRSHHLRRTCSRE